MNQENRNIIVSQQIQKAYRFLDQADEMFSMRHWDMAANRYYYACFHIVQGLFIAEGLSAHKHSGMITLFSMQYVKTGRIEKHYGSFLARMMQLRQKADYNCAYDITEMEVSEIVPLSREFVDKIAFIIKQ